MNVAMTAHTILHATLAYGGDDPLGLLVKAVTGIQNRMHKPLKNQSNLSFLPWWWRSSIAQGEELCWPRPSHGIVDLSKGKRYLSANGDGSEVVLSPEDDGTGRQRWVFQAGGDGWFTITGSGC